MILNFQALRDAGFDPRWDEEREEVAIYGTRDFEDMRKVESILGRNFPTLTGRELEQMVESMVDHGLKLAIMRVAR